MKRYFFAGLATILPILVTVLIINYVIKLLTRPFLGFIEPLLSPLHPMLALVTSHILILIMLFFIVILVGFLGRLFLVKTFFQACDRLIHKIPLANKVYKAVQDVMYTLFKQERPALSKPVQVPFPHRSSKSVGFITKENVKVAGKELAAIYVPGSPNPIMGFLFLMPNDACPPLPLSTEQSIKFVLSCGTVKPSHSKGLIC